MNKIFLFTFLISACFLTLQFDLHSEYDESTGLYKIDRIFKGENKGDNDVWRFIGNECRYCENSQCAKNNKIRCVVYYAKSSPEREKYKVVIRDGLLYVPERDVQECPVKGAKTEKKKSGPLPGYELLNTFNKNKLKKNRDNEDCYDSVGANIFVMDERGAMYTHPYNEPGKFHHSSFLAGEPVLFAGSMAVLDGEVKYIDNLSGHYKPRGEAIQLALNKLSELRIDISNIKTRMMEESEESKKLGAGKGPDQEKKPQKEKAAKDVDMPYNVYFLPVDYLSDPDKKDPDNALDYLNQMYAPTFDMD